MAKGKFGGPAEKKEPKAQEAREAKMNPKARAKVEKAEAMPPFGAKPYPPKGKR